MVNRLKNMVKKALNPTETKKLNTWKQRYQKARTAYSDKLTEMAKFDAYYNGTRQVEGNPNTGIQARKLANNVRNIVYELIESQVDSSIPMPKVTPIHEEDRELAKMIEHALVNSVKMLKMLVLNDEQERTVPVQGGDFFHVEWDPHKSLHCTLGDVSISTRHPSEVIPQPGVVEIGKMDYIFVVLKQTKDYIKSKYGVDVSDARTEIDESSKSESFAEDVVTLVMTYYRNKKGGVGLFSWVDDYVIEDMEDYQERKLERCTKCGAVKTGEVCECGSRKFKTESEQYEELVSDIRLHNGTVISRYTISEEVAVGQNNEPMLDEFGNPVMVQVHTPNKIPYYKPNLFPLVLRKNISKHKEFLGGSDVEVIIDQQDTIKKLGSKINEKLLTGGSFVTLPEGVAVEITDREMRVLRLQNPAQKAMIDVLTMQPDITKDLTTLETNYNWAKSGLGITDAFQGKYDPSATSGTAKQYSINQAAGRLESKRVMKNNAYAELYEMIFKFWLAYADYEVPVSYEDAGGETKFSHFDRYSFLKQDDAGEFYWDDEFIFEIDPTSTIMANREAMWQQIDLKYQAGAFGPIGELQTLLTLWTFLEKNNYPNAGEIKNRIEQQIAEEKERKNAVSVMQTGNGNSVIQV